MFDKKEKNQGLEGVSRREFFTGMSILLAGILVANPAEADNRANQRITRSRVAQELIRTPELIGQTEMERLVSCNNIISAHLLNPLFLQMISKVDEANNTFVINQEILDALLLAIENPYDLSYEIDKNDGADRNIIIKKRTPGAEGAIPDGFKIRVDMVPYSDIGHVVKVNDGGEVNEKLDPSHMGSKKITDIVSHHNSVINAELYPNGEEVEGNVESLPLPLKKWLMLANVIIPNNIVRVMRARGFDEAYSNNTGGSYADFAREQEGQNTNLNSYNDFISENTNWKLEINCIKDQPGFYRILIMIDGNPEDNNIDISLDGYILDADENGDVMKNTRGDGRKWQLDPMYYSTDPNGQPEHLLKSNYYKNHKGARGAR